MKKSTEQLQQELDNATRRAEQYQHQAERLQNRIAYIKDGQRKQRTHRLITRGAAVEHLAPQVRGMSESEFYQMMERVFSLPEVCGIVSDTSQQGGG